MRISRNARLVVILALVSGAIAIGSRASDPQELAFVVRVCEGEKFRFWLNDEALDQWSHCETPVADVPIVVVTTGGDRFKATTDENGIAGTPSIQLDEGETVRLAMACTTHQCLTLAGLFPGNNLVRHGENHVYVLTVRQEKPSGET